MCAGLKDKSHVHMATILRELLVSMGQLGAERESETGGDTRGRPLQQGGCPTALSALRDSAIARGATGTWLHPLPLCFSLWT